MTVGGAIDVWVYLAHGHVFAVAQSGNVALMGIALADGRPASAAAHLPSLIAFIGGLIVTRFALNQPSLQPGSIVRFECLILALLGFMADRMPQGAVTATVGFAAGVQQTALADFGRWNVQTSIITGNLRLAVDAAMDDIGDGIGRRRAVTITLLCSAFLLGAAGAAWITPRFGSLTMCLAAAILLPVSWRRTSIMQ